MIEGPPNGRRTIGGDQPRLLSNLLPRDADPVIRLFTDPEVRRYLGGPLTRADAESRMEQLLSDASTGRVWAIRRDPDEGSEAIGLVWLEQHRNGKDEASLSRPAAKRWHSHLSLFPPSGWLPKRNLPMPAQLPS
jgi:RimJ/RimL family protein N-acetyltransferase